MPPPATSNHDIWGDDDDDVILLLASQAVESLQQAEDDHNMDITSFDGFQPNKKSSTSTQKPVIISDDEDFLRDFLNENDQNEKMLSQMPNAVAPAGSENMFVMETDSVASTSRRPDNYPPANVLTNREHRNENIQKNISSCKDKEIKYMNKKLVEAKLQNDRFQEEIKQLTEKCQTKDGEVCVFFLI